MASAALPPFPHEKTVPPRAMQPAHAAQISSAFSDSSSDFPRTSASDFIPASNMPIKSVYLNFILFRKPRNGKEIKRHFTD